MLNYIWAGMIALSLLFAIVQDVRDEINDTYRNGQALPIVVELPQGLPSGARQIDARIRIDGTTFSRFYGTETAPDTAGYPGYLVRSQRGFQLRFAGDASFPAPFTTIARFSKSRDDELQGTLSTLRLAHDSSRAVTTVRFDPVHLVKINTMTEAALEFAETAATIALGLIGILSLFLGLLAIGEKAGLVQALVRVTQPVFRPLFPEIPDGHPAMGLIVLNLTANVLGLGNAATPFGLKAMEELQELNPEKNTATNSMVMLLALNTASVQLVPPTLLVAVMGLQVNELIFPIIIVTLLAAAVAVMAAKSLGKLRRFRETDPSRLQAGAPESI